MDVLFVTAVWPLLCMHRGVSKRLYVVIDTWYSFSIPFYQIKALYSTIRIWNVFFNLNFFSDSFFICLKSMYKCRLLKNKIRFFYFDSKYFCFEFKMNEMLRFYFHFVMYPFTFYVLDSWCWQYSLLYIEKNELMRIN